MHTLSPLVTDAAPLPARGWTPALKAKFLDRLAAHGNARAACRNVGLSHEAAYRLRRRDVDFARGWAAAILLARESSVQVLAEHAVEGIEEAVWYRGAQVGTRRRFDARLLLAHLARLDKLADEERAGMDAARFDELLARIAGEDSPVEMDELDSLLPPCREAHADIAAEAARDEVGEAWCAASRKPTARLVLGKARYAAYEAECAEAARDARERAEAEWSQWFDHACHAVDALSGWPGSPVRKGLPGGPALAVPRAVVDLAEPAANPREGRAAFLPRTLSHVSTSAMARALAGPARHWPGQDHSPHTRRSLRRSAIDLGCASA